MKTDFIRKVLNYTQPPPNTPNQPHTHTLHYEEHQVPSGVYNGGLSVVIWIRFHREPVSLVTKQKKYGGGEGVIEAYHTQMWSKGRCVCIRRRDYRIFEVLSSLRGPG